MRRTRTAAMLVLACAVSVVEASCGSSDAGRGVLLGGTPTSKAGAPAKDNPRDSKGGAGGEGSGDAAGAEPTSGGAAPPANPDPVSPGGSPSTSENGSGSTAGTRQVRQADSCFIYCEKMVAAGCIEGYTLGDCVDIACEVHNTGWPPACIDAWVAYYDCRLALPDICSAETCPDPALSGLCPT